MNFSAKIINWYNKNKRELPWRITSDPYKIWLSEIILQQTRVEQGTKYYLKFIEYFPDIFSLSSANEQYILKMWQGLGYYSRARNLHKTAKIIVNDFNGKFPETRSEIIKLPGIGDYTAAAILSICFNKPYAVIDGNVIRVLSRIYGIKDHIDTTRGKKLIKTKADSLIFHRDPGTYNQAVMEFGALFCKPQKPDCKNCIFSNNCVAFQSAQVEQLPIKKQKTSSHKRYFHYIIFTKQGNDWGQILINKREENDIWKNLYDFPLIEKNRKLSVQEIKDLGYCGINLKKSRIKTLGNEYKHILSHQIIFANFFLVSFEPGYFEKAIKLLNNNNIKLITITNIKHYPIPRLVDRFLENEGYYKKEK